MLQITFQFTNMADAAALLAQLDGHQVAGASLLNPISEAFLVDRKLDPARAKKSAAPAPADAPAQPTAEPTVAQPPAAAVADLVPDPAPAPTVAYADLQKAVLKLYAMDKAAASAIATEMGFASFKVMPAERWAEALAKVNAAIAARG